MKKKNNYDLYNLNIVTNTEHILFDSEHFLLTIHHGHHRYINYTKFAYFFLYILKANLRDTFYYIVFPNNIV